MQQPGSNAVLQQHLVHAVPWRAATTVFAANAAQKLIILQGATDVRKLPPPCVTQTLRAPHPDQVSPALPGNFLLLAHKLPAQDH